MIGTILGLPFLGFATHHRPRQSVAGHHRHGSASFPSPASFFSAGMLLMMFAGDLASGSGVFNVLWAAALLTGIGLGPGGNRGESPRRRLIPERQDQKTELRFTHGGPVASSSAV